MLLCKYLAIYRNTAGLQNKKVAYAVLTVSRGHISYKMKCTFNKEICNGCGEDEIYKFYLKIGGLYKRPRDHRYLAHFRIFSILYCI